MLLKTRSTTCSPLGVFPHTSPVRALALHLLHMYHHKRSSLGLCSRGQREPKDTDVLTISISCLRVPSPSCCIALYGDAFNVAYISNYRTSSSCASRAVTDISDKQYMLPSCWALVISISIYSFTHPTICADAYGLLFHSPYACTTL